MEWLERSMRKVTAAPIGCAFDPLLANVCQHPRFQQILNSMDFRRQQRNAGFGSNP